jgi:hypothetical protein
MSFYLKFLIPFASAIITFLTLDYLTKQKIEVLRTVIICAMLGLTCAAREVYGFSIAILLMAQIGSILCLRFFYDCVLFPPKRKGGERDTLN